MAAVSASGKKLPPMVVFQGQHVQSTWRPDLPRNHENYPWLYANSSGWMDSATFYKWFEEWEVKTRTFKEGVADEMEPRLLIYDGHLSHIWYGTLELARMQNVTIIKLPPHTTDLLQPLDVSVFRSLKGYWGDILFKRLRATRSRLTKAEFVTNLCDVAVWSKAFSENNIMNGFKACGIYPCDRTKYPVKRLNVNLKHRYDKWVEEGKPSISAEEIDEMLSEIKLQEREDSSKLANDNATPTSSRTQSDVTIDGKKGKIVSFFVPDDNSACMTPLPQHTQVGNTTPTSFSFKEMALKKIDELHTPKASQPQSTRKRVNPFRGLVTSDEQFQLAIEEAKKKEEKEAKKQAKKAKLQNKQSATKAKKKSKTAENLSKEDTRDDEDLPQVIEEDEESELESDSDDEQQPHEEKVLFPPSNESDGYEYLTTVWDEINPPVDEKEIVGKVFGVIYYDMKNKPHLFLGKIKRRFLVDADGAANEFLIECFKKAATSTSTIIEEVPDHLTKDITKFPSYDIISGPLNASVLRGTKWSVPEYPIVVNTFNIVKSLSRKDKYERLFAIKY